MPEYLLKIASNISLYRHMLEGEMSRRKRKKVFIEIIRQLNVCKTHWCSHMVRHLKRESIKNAYNEMFECFFDTLSYMRSHRKVLCRIEKCFIDNVIYIGLLHREIGYPCGNVPNEENFVLELQYDDSYCSWNANNNVHKIHHMRDGNKYNIRITAKATWDFFGFSITQFNAFYNKYFGGKNHNIPNEDEVVLKLRRDAIISTEKIPLNIKR